MKEFLAKYGTHTASHVINAAANDAKPAMQELLRELAADLIKALCDVAAEN